MMTGKRKKFLRRCLNIVTDGAEVTCDGIKTVPEGGAGNRKSPFADSIEVERRYCKLVGVGIVRQTLFNAFCGRLGQCDCFFLVFFVVYFLCYGLANKIPMTAFEY